MTPKLLTFEEVAELTRTPVATLRYWRHRGEGPPSFRIGRRVVFDEAAVAAWVRDRMDREHA